MNTKMVVRIALIAALYVVFTIGLAPISYGVIQFRVSELLKVFCLFSPWYSLAIGLGTFIANITSPFVGGWELVWMPLTDMFGGLLAFYIYKILRQHLAFIPLSIYVISTGIAVGIMLSMLGMGMLWVITFPIIASEAIILLCGSSIIFFIKRILESNNVLL